MSIGKFEQVYFFLYWYYTQLFYFWFVKKIIRACLLSLHVIFDNSNLQFWTALHQLRQWKSPAVLCPAHLQTGTGLFALPSNKQSLAITFINLFYIVHNYHLPVMGRTVSLEYVYIVIPPCTRASGSWKILSASGLTPLNTLFYISAGGVWQWRHQLEAHWVCG